MSFIGVSVKRAIILTLAAAIAVVVLLVLINVFRPPGPHFTCHRALDGTFDQWKIATGSSNWYPNVGGKAPQSLAVLNPYLFKADELRDYRYVPGLRSDDPEELVLLYVKEPTRRKWHGDTRWFRKQKGWVVLNPQSKSGEGDRWSEVAEWIPTDEFTNRLVRTLQFLAENERPHWTNVVQEHSVFLQSLQE